MSTMRRPRIYLSLLEKNTLRETIFDKQRLCFFSCFFFFVWWFLFMIYSCHVIGLTSPYILHPQIYAKRKKKKEECCSFAENNVNILGIIDRWKFDLEYNLTRNILVTFWNILFSETLVLISAAKLILKVFLRSTWNHVIVFVTT